MPRTTDSVVWSAKVDQAVLVAFTDVMKPSSVQWVDIVDTLRKRGLNATMSGLRYAVLAVSLHAFPAKPHSTSDQS